jgi:hypothetical protein
MAMARLDAVAKTGISVSVGNPITMTQSPGW